MEKPHIGHLAFAVFRLDRWPVDTRVDQFTCAATENTGLLAVYIMAASPWRAS